MSADPRRPPPWHLLRRGLLRWGNPYRRAAIAVLVRAFPRHCALAACTGLLVGVLPAVFALLVARLVDTLPGAVRYGLGAPAGRSVVHVLVGIGLVLAAQELVRAGHEVVRWNLYRRYEEYLLGRVLRANLSTPRLEFFDDPELSEKADRAVAIAQMEPGDLVDGLTHKWSFQAQGLAAAVLVGTVWPVAAAALALMWLAVGRRVQASLLRSNLHLLGVSLRHMYYYARLGEHAEWAKEVRVFGLVDWLSDRFGRHWGLVMAELAKVRRIDRSTISGLFAVVVVAHAVVLALAAKAVLDGTLGLGPVTVLVQGLLGMAFLANQSGDILIEYGASRIPTVLELERAVAARPAVPSGAVPSAARLVGGRPVRDITFDGVWFGYPGGNAPVFAGLDLRIEAGRSVGIVGLNGAGKTTLVKLLTGLEVPGRGRVAVDGEDLAGIDPDSWRRSVAVIFQDFVRYELPARDNIGFGAVEDLHAPGVDDRVAAAARRAGAEAILAGLPAGQDTPLSRRFTGGVDLSGGQWQRVALARAIMAVQAGARVLVLDEPTAQLDARAEADIYDRFLELTRGLTTVVISHRFSTVRRADRIVVLDGGRIAEDGSHDELVAAGGAYARLFDKQAMSYRDPGAGHVGR